MKDYNTNSNKTDGFSLEPVKVVLGGNRQIEAVHHVINESEKTLGLYINAREGGIDLKIPLCNVIGIAKSAAGAGAIDDMESTTDTIGSDRVESEEGDGLAADGGI